MKETETVDKETGEVTEVKPEEITVIKPEVRLPIFAGSKGLNLQTFDDMWKFAGCVVRSKLCPEGDTIETVVVKFQMGYELGISPMQSLQNIAVINMRPCVWGDIVPGIVEVSGKQEYGYPTKIGKRNPDGSFPDSYGYRYTTKRKGRDEYFYEFTVADAKKACLWNKTSKTGVPSTWVFYPDRMLLNRARTFCLRDTYPDYLKGLVTAEEAEDMVNADFTVEESKSRTEKLVDLITPQVQTKTTMTAAELPIITEKLMNIFIPVAPVSGEPVQPKEQFPTMADLEKDALQHLKKSIEAGEPFPPEPVTPEPPKRGRPPKAQDGLFQSSYLGENNQK